MKNVNASVSTPARSIDLGENPVNNFQAREYAKESSPSIFAVILELTENARDNATEITLTIDVGDNRLEEGHHILLPKRIICEDNGTGLTHSEFLNNFCGAYSDSAAHHEIDRAGRNGVGTKTYTSIADRIIVKTTTGRETEGWEDEFRSSILASLPKGLQLPSDGEPDTLWRVYDFRLHTRSALPAEWSEADPLEMGTRVELFELHEGIEINYELLVERLSYAREWLQHGANSFTVRLTGKVPTSIGKSKLLKLKPWSLPEKPWLAHATGRSDELIRIFDESKDQPVMIHPDASFGGVLEFEFKVVGKNSEGQSESLKKPALLLEICGALPYPPNLEAGQQSARAMPLLTFVGLEHSASIGAFCNAVSGCARINSLALKSALRNNKTTLAAGPGTAEVQALRSYLHAIIDALHKAWYNATRAGEDQASKDAVRQATQEVNLALKGVHRNPFKEGEVEQSKERNHKSVQRPPTKRHRWECGSCGKTWLAIAGFTPAVCAETEAKSGAQTGCNSKNIGLAKNQPRIGDCLILEDQLGDPRISAEFRFEKNSLEDEDTPVVRINTAGPRYVELRGSGSMSGQAQRRLKQYLIDMSLVAIAKYYADAKGTDFSEELGVLYYNRMLRSTGIKAYEAQVRKIQEGFKPVEQSALVAA